ncbi:hypothetical protein ACVWW6_008909 [Bradyrhizobium sp. USDA 3311]
MSVIITRGGVPADLKAAAQRASLFSTLDQVVESEALLADSAPEPMFVRPRSR